MDNLNCNKAPEGWFCSRGYGHDGPCAAHKVWADAHDELYAKAKAKIKAKVVLIENRFEIVLFAYDSPILTLDPEEMRALYQDIQNQIKVHQIKIAKGVMRKC